MQPKAFGIIAGIYALTSVLSFGIFKVAFASGTISPNLPGAGGLATLISPVVPKAGGGLNVDTSAPKTEVCPLNGDKFTASEKAAWDKRRPLAVMIENHPDARPQSGLGSTDIVYETVAEGGITRFMGIFFCNAQAKDSIVAPVRSARQAFLDYASEYNFPLYAHVGGANNFPPQAPGEFTDPRVRALEHIQEYGWGLYNDIDGMSAGYPTFVRNYSRVPGKEIATEHTMESSTYRLWDLGAAKRGLTNTGKDGKEWKNGFVSWEFQDDAGESERSESENISYDFWTGIKGFDVAWAYDKAANTYKRTMDGAPHLDANDQQQLTAKNVVVLYTKELPSVDTHKHVYYQTIGNGRALLFQNGKQTEVTWSKKDRLSRLTFIDKKGKPVKFVRGRIWISIIADGNTSLSAQ
jgi:hypothetical protein